MILILTFLCVRIIYTEGVRPKKLQALQLERETIP